ncbi:MAG: molybdopterin-dependent oxidoreductase [Desertimonas sp.]
MTAAAVALAVGELVSALGGGTPSLVTAIGGEFIDRFAAGLKDLAVSLFGTNDKTALIVGIVVIALAIGAGLGAVAVRRRRFAAGGFVAFGLIGWWAYATDPQGGVGLGLIAATLATAAGIGTLFGLAQLLPPEPVPGQPSATPGPHVATRRAVLGASGAALAVAVLGAVGSRRLRGSDTVDATRATTRLPTPANTTATVPAPGANPFDVAGLTPYITPNDGFYRIDTALQTPRVDVGGWTLKVTGMVDEPFELSYEELVELATTEETVTLSCVSNEVGGGLVGNAVWQGVPLATLLERAGVHDDADQIVGRSVDDFTAGFPTEVGLDGRVAMVAVAMNGEPLPVRHGFPARLVVAGLYGYVSATKWLSEIELTTLGGLDGYWISRGWAKEAPVKTQSRIDVPRAGARLTAGRQAIAGVAWAPPGGISRVEVGIDGVWHDADLGDAANGNTWVQWVDVWDATAGEHRIQVRATDSRGVTQTEEASSPAPDGATGWHSRTVGVV